MIYLNMSRTRCKKVFLKELIILKENSFLKKLYIGRMFIILFFLVSLMVMKIYENIFQTYSNGAGTLDMRLSYNGSDIYQLFESLGTGGRKVYIQIWCVDAVFIVCFALIQNYLIKWIMGKEMLNSKWRFVLSVPYLRALFDLVEDIMLFILLINFPSKFIRLGKISGVITSIKFVWLGIWCFSIPILILSRKRLYGGGYKCNQ